MVAIVCDIRVLPVIFQQGFLTMACLTARQGSVFVHNLQLCKAHLLKHLPGHALVCLQHLAAAAAATAVLLHGAADGIPSGPCHNRNVLIARYV